MILVRDVTELNRLLSMRQDFIANVSHELRTPLTVIVGYIETLMNEELDEATTRGLVGKLLSPTTRMRALVDDLLLLTRLESSPNPSQDELTSVDMGVVLNAIAADARMLSSGRHDIQVEIGTRTHVLGIDSELHSACLNLVTNAVRYSPDGGPIRISWTEVPDGARFAVEDHGMGIPKEHISRITERFYRVDLAQSRVRGGTGLGLAIVKHVLKRHNTFLQVESELGKGSTFFCVFPSSQLAVA
jgi:two-component system phosphate regulon sensor histidine kinase PhoR